MIKELIVVEGRDDINAVKRAVSADLVATNGFNMPRKTLDILIKAQDTRGVIIFTDPDDAGERIRKKLSKILPKAKHAFISLEDGIKGDDIGIENASPKCIEEALRKARAVVIEAVQTFTIEDMIDYRLIGEGSRERRDELGKRLGIGYANGKTFLKRLNGFGVRREEVGISLKLKA